MDSSYPPVPESPFSKLDAVVSPEQRPGYYFMAGMLYHAGITALDHLDRILMIIAQSEVLPLSPAEVVRRFADAAGLHIPYTTSDGNLAVLDVDLREISVLPNGGSMMATGTPLPEGEVLACDKCHTRLTRIGPFPDRRCPCGGTFEPVKDAGADTATPEAE